MPETVAPLVGAWIEIPSVNVSLVLPLPSLPLWERGLKLGVKSNYREWIKSLPLWERGLKSVHLAQIGN